jgi:thiol-disulfide isomerase/thioredoxin
MKKAFLPFIAILPLLLSSCSSTKEDIYLIHNAEMGVKKLNATYEAYSSSLSVDEGIALAKLDVGVFFCLTSSSCSHCLSFEPTFLSWAQDNYINYVSITDFASDSGFDSLKEYYSSYDWSSFGTPTIFYLSESFKTVVASGNVSRKYLDNFVSGQVKNSSGLSFVYHYSTLLGEKSDDTPIYFFDYSDDSLSYLSDIVSLGKNSSKSLLLFDIEHLDEEESASFESDSSLPHEAGTLSIGIENYNEAKKEEGLTLLSSYFAS